MYGPFLELQTYSWLCMLTFNREIMKQSWSTLKEDFMLNKKLSYSTNSIYLQSLNRYIGLNVVCICALGVQGVTKNLAWQNELSKII